MAAEQRLTDVGNATQRLAANMDELKKTVETTTNVLHQGYDVSFPHLQAELDRLEAMIKSVADRVDTNGAGMRSGYMKPACESKAIQNECLKRKGDYKCWHDKFVNALTQVYPKAQKYLQAMRRKLDESRWDITLGDWEDEAEADCTRDALERFKSDLDYILVEKTEEEALELVSEGESGDGFGAHQRMYLWFAGVSGQALNERKKQVLQLPTPKKAEEVVATVNKGMDQLKYMRNHGKDYELSIPVRVSLWRRLWETSGITMKTSIIR